MAKLNLDKRPTETKARIAVLWCIAAIWAMYSVVALWAISPLNKFDEPQIYRMQLVAKWDESYEGSKGHWNQRYMGHWREEKSGNVIALKLTPYMMHQMSIGTMVPMEFTPSRMGLGQERPWWMGEFALFWVVLWTVLVILVAVVVSLAWLCGMSFTEAEQKTKSTDSW